MSNILIATRPDDADSIYVKLALEKMGHNVTLWYTSDIPLLQAHTFRLNDGDLKWSSTGLDFKIDEADSIDVVWYRRPAKPKLDDLVHPDDLKNARNENLTFFKALWQSIAPKAFWINPPSSFERVNCKLTQLKIASKLGFKLPETIFSNDPDRIREFINSYPAGGVIYKPIYPTVWIAENEMRLTYTNVVEIDDLPSNKTLRLTPGIYQRRITKAYELRVTCMGHTAVASKLLSQEHESGIEDWRSVPPRQLRMEPYELPDEIANKCFALMLKLGVVFGCFDFIVTPEGEYIFLEINEQGQFLWQEEHHSNIKLLDPFVKFIDSRNPNFVWKCSEKSVTIPEFRESMILIQKRAMETHVNPGLQI